MYKRDARQMKISCIISWILTVGLVVYYFCLCMFNNYEMNVTGYVLIGACALYSVYATVKAVQAGKQESDKK